jgi:hypothetical protein
LLASVGVGDQDAMSGADPLAQSENDHLAAVDAATCADVDVFDYGLPVLDVRVFQQQHRLAVIASVVLKNTALCIPRLLNNGIVKTS